jgi:SAM-dependent methyltransferase
MDPGPYEAIAEIYDVWCDEVVEDIDFYVEACEGALGPVVEVGAGTGRIALPVAQAGHRVVAVDRSPGMLERLRRRAALLPSEVGERIETRIGTLEALPPLPPTDRVLAPFRTLLHLSTDEGRVDVFRAIRDVLVPGGRFVFDVFEPTAQDIRATHDRWIERDSGVRERARWDRANRRLRLTVSFRGRQTDMRLHWVEGARWPGLLERAGLRVVEAYGDFHGGRFRDRPGDSAWVAERPT